MSIIKPCDIRGRYPDQLDETTALRLGRAIGARFGGNGSHRIVVGGDVRISTAGLRTALITGLVESGAHVFDVGTVPTPQFYFARGALGIENGVMVTASHNPARYNGFKITLGEHPIEAEELLALAADMDAGLCTPRPGGKVTIVDLRERYIERILEQYHTTTDLIQQVFTSHTREITNPRIIIDCGNGCNSLVAPEVFRRAGFEIQTLFCEPDGTFPNREPNPAVAGNLHALQRAMAESHADLGVAFDGDADRVAFVDGSGRFIETDKSIAILGRLFASRAPGTSVVYDIKCSRIVHEVILAAGGKPIMERSGHTYMRATLLREGAVFGGELSGHCFFGDLGWDDALLAGLLFSRIIGTAGQAVIAELPQYVNTPDLRIPYHGTDREALLEELSSALETLGTFRLSRLDGIRGENTHGWALMRVSVTEPLLTFRFEGISNLDLEMVIEAFLAPIPRLLSLVQDYRTAAR